MQFARRTILSLCIARVILFALALFGCESKITIERTKTAGAVTVKETTPTGDGVALSWSSVSKAKSYEIIIAIDPACSDVLATKSVSENMAVVEAAFGTNFYVCIRPLDAAGKLIKGSVLQGFAVSYIPLKASKFSKIDCVDPDLSKVQVGQKVSLCDGSVAEGSAAVHNISNLTSGNIRYGVTIAGVTGTDTGSGGSACSSSNQTACLATSTFPAIDANAIAPYNLRSTSAAGSGRLKYCRAGYNLSIMDLPNAYVNMSFYGRLFTAEPSTDIITTTNKTFMQAFGPIPVKVITTGVLPGGLSSGVTYYTIWVTNTTIKLATSLANANAGTAVDLLDAGTGSHRINSVGDGVAQYWDVMDDTNSSGSTRSGWYTNSFFGSDYLCAASDWQILAPSSDGTTVVSGTSSDCDATGDDCMIQDKITGQIWTEVNPGGSGSALTWAQSIMFCNNLVFGGFSDWRLPIHEEFLQANIDGLYMFEYSYPFSGTSNVFFRTATLNAVSYNNSDNQAMWVHGNGGSQAENQHNTTQYGSAYSIRCVRN